MQQLITGDISSNGSSRMSYIPVMVAQNRVVFLNRP